MATYSDINIDQGSSFSSTITVKDVNGLPFDVVGYSARGQIRKSYTSLTAIDFSTVILTPTTLGHVGISLTSAVTRGMKPGRYVFDVEIYNISNDVIRIAEGQVSVSPAATHIVAPLSTVSDLSELMLSYGTLNPEFTPKTLSYTISFPNHTTDIALTPISLDDTSTIKINGIPVISRTSSNGIALIPGVNVITIVVLAQDGVSTSTYTITCTI